jgi:hypothetical protein
MAANYSNGGNRWNNLGFNFTKRDALSSVYKISMDLSHYLKRGELILIHFKDWINSDPVLGLDCTNIATSLDIQVSSCELNKEYVICLTILLMHC